MDELQLLEQEIQDTIDQFRGEFREWTDRQHQDLSTSEYEAAKQTSEAKATRDVLLRKVDAVSSDIENEEASVQSQQARLETIQKELANLKMQTQSLPADQSQVELEIAKAEAQQNIREKQREAQRRQSSLQKQAQESQIAAYSSSLGLSVRPHKGQIECALSQAHPQFPSATLTFTLYIDSEQRLKVQECNPSFPQLLPVEEQQQRTNNATLFLHQLRQAFAEYLATAGNK